MQWSQDRACKDAPEGLFYDDARTEQAKALCARCPIAYECFSYAVDNREENGIWGGEIFSVTMWMSEDDFPHGTYYGYVRGCHNNCPGKDGVTCSDARRAYRQEKARGERTAPVAQARRLRRT